MYNIRVTYYDSPREDFSGFYFNDYKVSTPREAYRFAERTNRVQEPRYASVNLTSGKPRIYKLFVNNSIYCKTTNISEFREQVSFLRNLKLKDRNMYTTINYRFEIN